MQKHRKEYTFYNNPVEMKQTRKNTSKPDQKPLAFCSTQENIAVPEVTQEVNSSKINSEN